MLPAAGPAHAQARVRLSRVSAASSLGFATGPASALSRGSAANEAPPAPGAPRILGPEARPLLPAAPGLRLPVARLSPSPPPRPARPPSQRGSERAPKALLWEQKQRPERGRPSPGHSHLRRNPNYILHFLPLPHGAPGSVAILEPPRALLCASRLCVFYFESLISVSTFSALFPSSVWILYLCI